MRNCLICHTFVIFWKGNDYLVSDPPLRASIKGFIPYVDWRTGFIWSGDNREICCFGYCGCGEYRRYKSWVLGFRCNLSTERRASDIGGSTPFLVCGGGGSLVGDVVRVEIQHCQNCSLKSEKRNLNFIKFCTM